MEVKEITYRGISRSLSDMKVEDGGCSESVNVIVQGGEIVPVIPPVEVDGVPKDAKYDLIFIHKVADGNRMIGLTSKGIGLVTEATVSVFFTFDSGETFSDIQALGNTLVIATNQRMMYVLYTGNTYKLLGSQMPEPDIDFNEDFVNTDHVAKWLRLTDAFKDADVQPETWLKKYLDEDSKIRNPYNMMCFRGNSMDEDVDFERNFFSESDIEDPMKYDEVYKKAQEIVTKAIWGKVAPMLDYVKSNDLLTYPIFVRYAYRLYDGTTYTMQSAPILLGASVPQEYFSVEYRALGDGSQETEQYANLFSVVDIKFKNGYKVKAKINNISQIEQWSDIIQGIDFFFSEPIYPMPTDTNVERIKIGVFKFDQLNQQELDDTLLSKSNFYLVLKQSIQDMKTNAEIDFSNKLKFDDEFATRQRLPDDFNSHQILIPETLYEYNGRMNLANIRIRHYDGPMKMPSIYQAETKSPGPEQYVDWIFYFFIRPRGGGKDIIVSRTYRLPYMVKYQIPGCWITYPDPRCYKVHVITKRDFTGENIMYVVPMKEHPLLNLSYYFSGFGTQFIDNLPSSPYTLVIPLNEIEPKLSSLYQSEVNNPFVFRPEGVHTIPASSISGLATTAMPISQGQFGQHPLYAFCNNGIWAFAVGDEGYYTSMVPLLRDVCTNRHSITQLDNAVVFVTRRGVMVLQGSQAVCISDNMNGLHFRADELDGSLQLMEEVCKTKWGSDLPSLVSDDMSFIDYAQECFIAYDYAHSRLMLVNPKSDYQYIYSFESRTWHKLCISKKFKRAVNSYPECYMQEEASSGDVLYSFSRLQDVNDLTGRIFGLIVTRGMELDAPQVLKTVHQLYNRGTYDRSMLGCMLYGSRDGIRYVHVRSLKGSSFRFYRIVLFMNLLPKERLSRTTIGYEKRWTNKLR